MRIKICGICSMEDAVLATSAGADAIGFVFAPGPRRVTLETVESIISAIPPFVVTVGVFANAAHDEVQNIAARCKLQALQFQGDEPPEYCSQFIVPVIKGFKIRRIADLAPVERYAVAAYLFDSYVPGKDGGTGQSFDWAMIAGRTFSRSVIVAGGLTAINVEQAIKILRPAAVDVSTGVAQENGRHKDPSRLTSFIMAAREAARQISLNGEQYGMH